MSNIKSASLKKHTVADSPAGTVNLIVRSLPPALRKRLQPVSVKV